MPPKIIDQEEDLKKPSTLFIHEDLLLLCGRQYTEALILDIFLSKGFDTPKPYSIDKIGADILLNKLNRNAVMRAVQRLVDKKYISESGAGDSKGLPTKWVVHRSIINRDLLKIGFKSR